MSKVRYSGAEVQAQVMDYARTLGLPVERRNVGVATYTNPDGTERKVRYGIPGDPDLEITIPSGPNAGRVLHIEAKATGELPTFAQLNRIMRLNQVGRIAMWTDSLDTVIKVLPEIIKGGRIRYITDTRAEIYFPDAEGPSDA